MPTETSSRRCSGRGAGLDGRLAAADDAGRDSGRWVIALSGALLLCSTANREASAQHVEIRSANRWGASER